MRHSPAFSFAVLIALSLVGLGAAGAQERLRTRAATVLELFTSQGCASCPAADALLSELAGREDVIALAYHVDYWDYVGWPDTFGSAANTARQRAYSSAWGGKRIFTPQLVINGASHSVGSRREEVEYKIGQAAPLALPIALSVEDGMLSISAEGQAGLEHAMVWLVTYRDHADIAIPRGENAGKTMTYTHIVTGRQLLGMWEPGSGASLKLPLSQVLEDHSNGAVILIQPEVDGLPGPIVGAAALQLQPPTP